MPENVEATTASTQTTPVVKPKATNDVASEVPGIPEVDEFGLSIRKRVVPVHVEADEGDIALGTEEGRHLEREETIEHSEASQPDNAPNANDSKSSAQLSDSDSEEDFKDASSTPNPGSQTPLPLVDGAAVTHETTESPSLDQHMTPTVKEITKEFDSTHEATEDIPRTPVDRGSKEAETVELKDIADEKKERLDSTQDGHSRQESIAKPAVSEWSHQQLAPKEEVPDTNDEGEWQTMPAFAPYDMYDDDNRLIAKEEAESDDGKDVYAGLGGAGRGYTRVQLDEDAQSATSLDENTKYLFKDTTGTGASEELDEEQRDALSQMQATKDLLTEGQRIAYVGMTRLILTKMLDQVEVMPTSRTAKKETQLSVEAMKMWSQKMMVRLYAHMEISTAEQVMIEQLSEHGVIPSDLTPTLMQNARVKNPMAEKDSDTASLSSPKPDSIKSFNRSPSLSLSSPPSTPHLPSTPGYRYNEEESAAPPPAYREHEGKDLPEVRMPSQLPTTKNIDIDLRWTVLCDLFLTLIADSVYDARSRVLLEKVGENMEVPWLEICRFEKRVTDALEMQQSAEKENWNEDEHKENRRKMALKKRYMMMGLATVGGSLVIGLSAGLLAPVIGAGLAAGFTTIGVAGTSGFLAGAGGAAIITSGAAASGGVIAVRAANRRTGAVQTFEYRPLHNNKRVNLIVTVSGWMTGKVDDVRLPYSTVDPIMGDIYSVLWEPEMLRSMGDTINILATEASIAFIVSFMSILIISRR
jgi:hypothetical protein